VADTTATLVVRIVGDAQNAAASLSKVADSARSVGSRLASGIGKGINAVATATATVVGLTATATAGVVAQGVAYNVLNQQARAAFTTVLGSAKAADKMLSQLTKFASTSPFPRQAFIEATQQMLSFGFAAKDVIPTLDAVQNAVAATGGSATDILEIVDVLSKVQSTGKITAETLNELGYRGIDAAKIIGQQMGKTAGQIRDSISKGTLGAQAAIKALTAGMAKNFAGAAAGLKSTWIGAMDRIKGATRDIGSALVEPFISVKGGGYAVVWANQIADILRQLQATITPILTGILAKLTPVFDAITKALSKVDLASVFDRASSALSGLGPLVAAVAAGLTAMGSANIAGLLGPFGALVPEISPVVAIIAALVATMPELRTVVMQIVPPLLALAKTIGATLGAAIKSAMPAIASIVTALGGVLVNAVTSLAPAIGDLVTAIAPLIPEIANMAAQIVGFLAPGLNTVVGVIGDVVGWLMKFSGPVKVIVAAIGAWVAVQWALNAAMAANPIGLIVAGVALLIVAVVSAYKKVAWFRAACQAVFGAIAAVVRTTGAVINAIWSGIKTGASAVLNWIKGNWPILIGVLFGPFGIAAALIIKNWAKVKKALAAAMKAIRRVATATGRGLRAAFAAAWNAIKAAARATTRAIVAAFRAAWSVLRGAVRAYGATVRAVFNALRSAASSTVGRIKSLFKTAWSAITSAARAMKSTLLSVWSAIASKISTVISKVGSLVSKFKSISVPGTIKSAIDAIGSAIDRVISAVSSLISKLRSIPTPHINWPSPPSWFNKLHLGAVAPPIPTTARRGGYGAPAVPMGRGLGATALAAPGGVHITVNGAVDPENTARQIQRILQGHQRRMGVTVR
jgi:tape measure domain-containing protein